MLDVSTAPEGKQWKSSWKCFQFWQPNAKPSLKSKMVGAAVWARLSVSQDQQQDCVTGAVAGFFKRLFSEFYGLFQDGWSLLRVIWSESDTARVRSSPPPCTTMERSWWRTFASNWPPPSWLGPPSQAWPVAPSNPTQHLHIPEWWIGAPSPFLHWQTHTHTQPCPFGLRSRERGCFCCLSSANHQTAHSWDPEPWPGPRTARETCSRVMSEPSAAVAANVSRSLRWR